jgi:hypothetical protein
MTGSSACTVPSAEFLSIDRILFVMLTISCADFPNSYSSDCVTPLPPFSPPALATGDGRGLDGANARKVKTG